MILWVLSFFVTFAHKLAETWFVSHETWQTTLFGIYHCVKVVRIEYHSHMLEIKRKVAILWFLYFFGTFAHKVAQTWFVLHETWHLALFGIYYCIDLVRIENHSNMLEITC